MNSGKIKSLVFFGTEDFSLIALEKIVDAGFPVAYVITKPDTPKGRGHKLQSPAVKIYAESHNIPVLQPQKLSEIEATIRSLESTAGILVSYGKIIPDSILNLFEPGIINVHPSLLPKYRGPSPIETAVLNGDRETGVSIMMLSADMDAGPVYTQQAYSLNGGESIDALYLELGTLGAKLLVETLPAILDGELIPTPQDSDSASYCSIIKKSDGIIDWTKPASVLEREIRAYSNWPQSRTTLGLVDVIITHAIVTNDRSVRPGEVMVEKARLLIGTGTDVLEITSVKPLGKKEMSTAAFLAGYRSQLG